MTIYAQLLAKATERWRHAGCDQSSSLNFGTKHGALQQSPSCDLCWLEAFARQVCADARRSVAGILYEEDADTWQIQVQRDIIGGPDA